MAPPGALAGQPLSNTAPDDIGATFQGGSVSAVGSAIQSGARSRRRNDVRGGRKPCVVRAAERCRRDAPLHADAERRHSQLHCEPARFNGRLYENMKKYSITASPGSIRQLSNPGNSAASCSLGHSADAIDDVPGADRACLFDVATTPLRRQSKQRLTNMRTLVAEFSVRDLGYGGVALLLDCSSSAARNYICELLDAGLITSHQIRLAAGCVDRTRFRLTDDPGLVRHFLAGLGKSQGGDGNSRRVHRALDYSNSSSDVDDTQARRDPLVTALFGAPGKRKD